MTEKETLTAKNKMAQIQKGAAMKCFEAIKKELLFYDAVLNETFEKIQEIEKNEKEDKKETPKIPKNK